MKTMKLLLTIICYSGTGAVFVNQRFEGAIIDALSINPLLQKCILILLIMFWLIRITWFIYDHFYLESKERKQVMREHEKALNE